MRQLILPLALGIALAAIPGDAFASTSVAYVDPEDGRWYVPNRGETYTDFTFGSPDDIPISGDWDCNGVDSPGRFRSDGYFYLRNALSDGEPDIAFHFGVAGDRPLVGDWNGDGCDTVAVFRPSESAVYSADRLGVHVSWRAQRVSGTPLVADLNGDGREEISGYRPDSEQMIGEAADPMVDDVAAAYLLVDGDLLAATDIAYGNAVARLTPLTGRFGIPCPTCEDARPALAVGDSGAWVEELRARLTVQGFRPGEGDTYDANLKGAVTAFEKYHRLDRDGVFTNDHWALLDTAIAVPYRADTPTRVEVDLDRQILFLIIDHQPAGVIPVSSASGDTYISWNGKPTTARTPEGEFTFYRDEDGWYRSYLGSLYEPMFFRGGYAIHGSNSVPTYPASAGCIRTRVVDQDWLKPQLEMGMPVFVYGLRTEAPQI